MWKEDAKVDRIELGDTISLVGNLHAKYLQIFFEERARLLSLKTRQAALKKLRWEYWNGKLSLEQLKEQDWEPQPLIILKMDLPMYMEADEVMITINNKVDMQIEKIAVIDSIIKAINQRGFQLNTLLNWEKFRSGN